MENSNPESEITYPGEEKSIKISAFRRWTGRIIKLIICAVILGASIAGASYIVKTAPRPEIRPPVKKIPVVQAQEISLSTEQITIQAMGKVMPAQQVVLKSSVSGEIVYIHQEFTEGGLLPKGIEILRIDPEDYELTVKQKRRQVSDAEYALKIEMGHQEIARREWELLNLVKKTGESDGELALRKPHLEKAEADLAAAEAELRQSEVNLSRTSILSPFNAMVRTKSVDIGSQISTQEQLAEIIGTDEFWIQVSLPMDRLKWIDIPRKAGDPGSGVRIYYSNKEKPLFRDGEIVKLLPDLESQGRMARLLVSIKDPLALNPVNKEQLPLLIGQYVTIDIKGHKLKNVIRIPDPLSGINPGYGSWIRARLFKLRK